MRTNGSNERNSKNNLYYIEVRADSHCSVGASGYNFSRTAFTIALNTLFTLDCLHNSPLFYVREPTFCSVVNF